MTVHKCNAYKTVFSVTHSWLLPPPSCGPADGFWGELCCLCLFCLVTPDQAADDHVKIKITKYKTGSSPDGEVKVQEMGEGDPQWQHIKDVVKEQLEKAGLKAEGMRGSARNTHGLFSLPSVILSICSSVFLVSSLSKSTQLSDLGFSKV